MIRRHIQLDEREAVMETKNRSSARGTFRTTLPAMALVMLMNTAGYAAANSTTFGERLAEALWGAPTTDLAESSGCLEGTDGWEYSCADHNWLQTLEHGSSADDLSRNDEIEIHLSASEVLDKDHKVYTSTDTFGLSSTVVVTEPQTRGFQLGVQFWLQYRL